LIMTVNASVPAKSVAEVIALAKAQPGALAFASSGNGGAPHLAGELFKRITGTDLLHVPYRGSGPAVVDLVAGRVAIMFDAAPSLLPFVQADKLRPLAAASAERNRLLSDIPTFAELGFAGMEISLWYGIVAPTGTPLAIVRRLNAELVKIWPCPKSATPWPSRAPMRRPAAPSNSPPSCGRNTCAGAWWCGKRESSRMKCSFLYLILIFLRGSDGLFPHSCTATNICCFAEFVKGVTQCLSR
jgi:hypothetical protein